MTLMFYRHTHRDMGCAHEFVTYLTCRKRYTAKQLGLLDPLETKGRKRRHEKTSDPNPTPPSVEVLTLGHSGMQYVLAASDEAREAAGQAVQHVMDAAKATVITWPSAADELPALLDAVLDFAVAARSRKAPVTFEGGDADGYHVRSFTRGVMLVMAATRSGTLPPEARWLPDFLYDNPLSRQGLHQLTLRHLFLRSGGTGVLLSVNNAYCSVFYCS